MKKIKKNVIINTIGSTIYAITSLIFLIVVTRINGVNQAGIFTFGFTFACLLISIGNYSTRSFQVTENDPNIKDEDFIYHRILTVGIMIIFGTLYCLFNKYVEEKIIIIILLVIYKGLESFSDVYYGYMQKEEELYKVGISHILKAVFGTLFFITTNILTKNLILSIIVLILITLIITIFYDYKNIKKYQLEKSTYSNKKMIKMFKIGFLAFLLSFLINYTINTQKYIIDILLGSEKQTVYGIIIMPITFITMFSQFVIQPFLVKMKKMYTDKNYQKLKKIIFMMILIIVIVGIIIVIIGSIIGIPFLNFVYNINLNEYHTSFIIILIGSIFYAIISLLTTIYIAIRKNKFQNIVFIIFSVISTIFAYIMIKEYEILGASISYLILMTIIFIVYLIPLHNFLSEKKKKN